MLVRVLEVTVYYIEVEGDDPDIVRPLSYDENFAVDWSTVTVVASELYGEPSSYLGPELDKRVDDDIEALLRNTGATKNDID